MAQHGKISFGRLAREDMRHYSSAELFHHQLQPMSKFDKMAEGVFTKIHHCLVDSDES